MNDEQGEKRRKHHTLGVGEECSIAERKGVLSLEAEKVLAFITAWTSP